MVGVVAGDDMNVIVAEHAGQFIGFGAMAYSDADAHLYLLAVLPRWQSMGADGDMLDWLELVARNLGAPAVRVQALARNLQARMFYEQHGYVLRFADAEMYDGLGGVHLEKRLGLAPA
jgi:GNAT superfamily N-acetyltransferase